MIKFQKVKGFIIIAFFAAIGLVACTSNKEKLAKSIYDLETSDSSATNNGMNNLSDLYFQFSESFPKDSISEKYLYKGFMFKYLTKHWDDAIKFANVYKSRYPNTESYHNINLKLADLYNSGKTQLDSAGHYYLLAEGKAQFSTAEKRQAGIILEKYGNANKNPAAVFSSAKFHQMASEFEDAVRVYDVLATNYPDYNKSPDALLAAGFICWDNIKDSKRATDYYKKLVEKYPNHPLAKEAKTLLDENMLTMTDLELSEYIMNKNKTQKTNAQ